ncbi:MAG: PD40 domain-containing protein [Bacteroidetes Order II. Incertae sedis bacterium]|nr:PD40 domain-containing protein [Bacteroidetes Order II. bacterium]
MQKTLSITTWWLGMLLCIQCLPAQSVVSDEEAIRMVWEQYRLAWLKNDPAGVMAPFEEEARISPDGLVPIKGFADIQAYWFPQDGSETHIHGFDLDVISVKVEQNMAFTTQKTRLDWTYLKDGNTVARIQSGWASAVLRRQSNGTWKIWRLQWTNYAVFLGAVPELLAPAINSPDPEFASALSPDGRWLFFNRTSPDRSRFYWLTSEKNNTGWGEARLFPHNDTTFMDIDPIFSPDGRAVIFSSNRPMKGNEKKDFDLWQSTLRNGQWSPPKPVSSVLNSKDDEIYSTLTRDGVLYFSRFVGNKAQIYRSVFRNGRYQPPEGVTIPGTEAVSIINPAISPDGTWLVFASGGLTGKGSGDLYATKQIGPNRWSSFVNLSRINSTYADFAPSFSPDGKTLFFTSERPGLVKDFPKDKRRPGDLYQISFSALLPDLGQE